MSYLPTEESVRDKLTRGGALFASDEVRLLSERLEGVASLACDLLDALRPWEMHGPSVRSAAARLTLALATTPLPKEKGTT